MHDLINAVLFKATESELLAQEQFLATEAQALSERAFAGHHPGAHLEAHRTLYAIYLAQLSVPWRSRARNAAHPVVAKVRHSLQAGCDQLAESRANQQLGALPAISDFAPWITHLVREHRASPIHPVFHLLRDTATRAQLAEFLFQESPLEMLFGDIVALMLPGVYGSIKGEIAKNFWDEVGQAQDDRVHRNLRARLMTSAAIPDDAHLVRIEEFVVEELALVNLYLGMAFNRSKLTQLVGAMLATELVIPGRFNYLIDGWRRVGASDHAIEYLTEHTTVDERHADDWLNKVVRHVLADDPTAMRDIAIGALRRLDGAYAVCESLHRRLLTMPSRNPSSEFTASAA